MAIWLIKLIFVARNVLLTYFINSAVCGLVITKGIFEALENVQQGKINEIQLTDAIQKLVETGKNVKAIRVDNEKFWDVGTPEAYWEALCDSNLYSKELKWKSALLDLVL